MIQTVTKIGPRDHGRRMSLAEFDPAEGQEGYLYELSRGMVMVMDVPNLPHMFQVDECRQQLSAYRARHPKRIVTIAAGMECKLLVREYESERHPDVAIYLVSPPDDPDFWATWAPAIVIEVVSPGSEERDYFLKREEYLCFGVKEYWIIDAQQQQMTVHRRVRGKWVERVVKPPQLYRTDLLPGFKLDCQAIFDAGARAR